jgi:hypothetical protein
MMFTTEPLLPPVFHGELRLEIELLDRVDRHEGRRCEEIPTWFSAELLWRIAVIGSVEREVIRAVAIAIDAELTGALLRSRHARAFDRRARS